MAKQRISIPKAFPKTGQHGFAGTEFETSQEGMDLRDYFAGQALTGYMANPKGDLPEARDIVPYIFDLADWMIRERAKRSTVVIGDREVLTSED